MIKKIFNKISVIGFCGVLAAHAATTPLHTTTITKTVVTPEEMPVEPVVKPLTLQKPAATKPHARIWNLQDADIISVINEVSGETGKTFVIDPRVSGKITLVSSQPLKEGEVYNVFLSVLSLLGYSAIPDGNVVKIVPNMESGEQATKVASTLSPGKGDEVVVRVVTLNNVSASQLIPVVRPLLPQWSNVSAYGPGNVLILLGRASNIQRIIDVVTEVDQAADDNIQIVPLRYIAAQQVAAVLNRLDAAARTRGQGSNVSVAVDDRSNSVLLSGSKSQRMKMRFLIMKLDVPSKSSAGNTEVVYLKYQEAKKIAPLLAKVAENIQGKGSSDTGATTGASTTSNATSETNSTQQKKEDDQPAPINSANIQAEPNTNAIIITAPPTLMSALKTVIAKLDIRPAQVLVEAVIAEVDESNLISLGIQWGSVASNGQVQATGTTVTSFPGLGAGIVGIIPSTHIQAILSLLQNQNGVDILSTPSVMVLDNQKASIEVGQDVPMQTGSYATTGQATTATPFTTVDTKPVTLKLEVTPQINLGESVRLTLDLKNDTLQNPQNPGLTPIVNTSKISNSVIINSQDILVLGGLISRSSNENINKVPILGDLPVIGSVFQQKTHNQQKKNLMVFIKPIIMETEDDATEISEMKYTSTRNTEVNFHDDLRDIGKKPLNTALPEWDGSDELPRPFGAETE